MYIIKKIFANGQRVKCLNLKYYKCKQTFKAKRKFYYIMSNNYKIRNNGSKRFKAKINYIVN